MTSSDASLDHLGNGEAGKKTNCAYNNECETSRSDSSFTELRMSADKNVEFEEIPPKDKFYLIYAIFVLNGGAIYLSWNLLNFLSPTYYFTYWFSEGFIPTHFATDFMNSLGMDACSPLFATTLICVIPLINCQLIRAVGSLAVNLINIAILLIVACTSTPSFKGMSWFYNLTFIVMLIMMGANGIYQSSLYSLAADFPKQYSNALIIGTNAGGVLASLLYILTTAAKPSTPNPTAVAYYGVTLAYLLLCSASLVYLWKSEFFQFYLRKGNEERKMTDNSMKGFFAGMGMVFKDAWPELLNIFLIFFTMYAVYPTFSVGIQPWPTPGVAHLKPYYLPIGTFLNYYTLSLLGAIAACFINVCPTQRRLRLLLCIPCVLSLLFIPYFMYCNFIPNYPDHRVAKVIFKNEWFYFIGNGFLGLVVGFLSGNLLMLVSRVVDESIAQLAAKMGTFAMITGLYVGAGMSALFISFLE